MNIINRQVYTLIFPNIGNSPLPLVDNTTRRLNTNPIPLRFLPDTFVILQQGLASGAIPASGPRYITLTSNLIEETVQSPIAIHLVSSAQNQMSTLHPGTEFAVRRGVFPSNTPIFQVNVYDINGGDVIDYLDATFYCILEFRQYAR